MLTLFTWGYWGWGNATSELVRAVDATERERGFEPPLFVDIRFRRSGRAKAFSGGTFEDLVTQTRYWWMQCLGNRSVVTGERRVHIVCPSAAKELLDLATRYKRENRRILFFCACEYPRWCHRNTVAKLILKEAERAGRHAEIVEWPGGTPLHRSIDTDLATYKAVLRGRQSVPLGKRVKLGEKACLPWGSIVSFQAGGDTLSIVTGPAKCQNGWFLPVLECGEPRTDQPSLRASSKRFRKEKGMELHRV